MAPVFGTVRGRDLPCVIYCFLDVNDKINYSINDNKKLVKFEVLNDSALALLYGEKDGINERCNIFCLILWRNNARKREL